MSVQDGQDVNAAVNNASNMSRNSDTSTIGEVKLENTSNPDSGATVTNAQRLLNELADVQGNTGEGDSTSKNYSSNNVVANGDDRKEAVGKLDATYNGTTGHDHDGTDGNGAKVSATNLNDFNNLFAEFGEYTFDAASGTSIDVSALYAAQTSGGDASTEGVITSAPNNYIPIVEKTNGGEIEDAEGDRVFGRVTESAGTWTLSFFTNESGVETAHNLSSQDISFLYREVFTAANRPTIGANVGVYDTQSAIGDIPDASATQRGVVSTSAQTLAGDKNFQDGLEVGGVDVVDLSSTQTLNGKTFSDPITFTELGSTPSTPSAGLMKVYPKTDKKMYKLDDAGAESELGGGAGGGSGIRNFAQDFQSADSTTGYTTGQSALFDDTGSLGATFSVDSATPIFGNDSLKLENITANDWISIQGVSIDSGARGKLLGFKVNYTYNGDDQPLLKVKDGDGNEVDENRIKIFNTTQDSTNQREAKCLWVQPQTGTASETVTVGFHFPNATGVEDFVFDEVVVTDDAVTVIESSENEIGKWKSYTPLTQGFGTLSSVNFRYRENGENLDIQARFTAGTVSATEVQLGLPGAYTIHSDLTDYQMLGPIMRKITHTENFHVIAIAGNGYLQLGHSAGTPLEPEPGTNITASSDSLSFSISVPVNELNTSTQSRFLIEQGENLVNDFSARIQNNGASTLTSKSGDFLDTITPATRISTGVTEVFWKAGVFTIAPKVNATPSNSVSATRCITVYGITTSGCFVRTYNTSGAVLDSDFELSVESQGTDVINGMGVAAIAGKTHEDDSYIHLGGNFVLGSDTGNCIMTMGTVLESKGSALTYTQDTVYGDTFTVNESGTYVMSTGIYWSSTTEYGFSRNATDLTTRLQNIADKNEVLGIDFYTASEPDSVSASAYLYAGDIIRFHLRALGAETTTDYNNFSITKVGKQPLLDAGAVISEDPSKINEFSARIEGQSGSPSVVSSNADFIDSVNNVGTGRIEVVFKPGLFTISPSGEGTVENRDGRNCASGTFTTSSVRFNLTDGGTQENNDISISISRQGTDVVPLADRVSSFSSTVYKTRTSRTAVLRDIKAATVNGGTSSTGVNTRVLNTQEGGNSFCSLSSNQFTLIPGTYFIRATSPTFQPVRNQAKLRNITLAETTIVGSNEYASASAPVNSSSIIEGEFTVLVSTVFEIQHYIENGVANDGLGVQTGSGEVEVYTQATIEKLD